MKYTRMIAVLLVLCSNALTSNVFAHGGGGHGGGHGGGGGHWGGGYNRGGYGGYGGAYALGAMVGLGGLYYGSMGYPYNYGYNYPYYSQSAMPIQQAAPVYIQQSAQPATIPPPPAALAQPGQNSATNNQNVAGNWYFCRESNAYYPYVNTCPNGWEQVAPTPPQ
ncbi:hypothetical protein [Methylomonas sp. AM2-LC]|uniref:hypothetical protein n=1 Tax=Methylomonas sp. AM2-LC TaxID=3153301 RepID=UPI003263D5D2